MWSNLFNLESRRIEDRRTNKQEDKLWSNLFTLEGRKIEDRRTNRRTNVE